MLWRLWKWIATIAMKMAPELKRRPRVGERREVGQVQGHRRLVQRSCNAQLALAHGRRIGSTIVIWKRVARARAATARYPPPITVAETGVGFDS